MGHKGAPDAPSPPSGRSPLFSLFHPGVSRVRDAFFPDCGVLASEERRRRYGLTGWPAPSARRGDNLRFVFLKDNPAEPGPKATMVKERALRRAYCRTEGRLIVGSTRWILVNFYFGR